MPQVSEAPNGMHAQQLQQQLNQMPQQQQQQTSMPTQSSAPTVELKAPNNQSQTVQLDLSNVNNMLQLQVQCRSTPASPSLVPSQACCRSEKTSATFISSLSSFLGLMFMRRDRPLLPFPFLPLGALTIGL